MNWFGEVTPFLLRNRLDLVNRLFNGGDGLVGAGGGVKYSDFIEKEYDKPMPFTESLGLSGMPSNKYL